VLLLILVLAALLCFALAAFGEASKVNLMAVGLFLLTLALGLGPIGTVFD
jgi:hypothetical protein